MLSNPAEISRITTEKLEIKYVISKALEEQKMKIKYNSKINLEEGDNRYGKS